MMHRKEAAAILIRQAAAMIDGAAALLKAPILVDHEYNYDYETDRACDLLACAANDLERAEKACK
jgi:hypothetical protein